MMKEAKWAIAVLVILWGANKELESQGFCMKKMAFLPSIYTEQELIDRAIAYKIKHIPGSVWVNNRKEEIKIIPYADVEEFKQKNPNCCKLTRKLPENAPPEDYGYVRISYFEYYDRDLKPGKYSDHIPYNSCGEIIVEH